MASRNTYDEAQVIEQLRDPAAARTAFGKVIEHYSSTLYWHIRRMVLDHDDANDILQNVLIRAWTGINSFRGECKLRSWLFRIASNECYTFLTQQQNRFPVSMDDDESNSVASQLEADEYFDGSQLQARLQEAIATLPPRQRQVFNMRYYDEMKYEDMAEILETSVGALKASYHFAVEKISAFFSDDN